MWKVHANAQKGVSRGTLGARRLTKREAINVRGMGKRGLARYECVPVLSAGKHLRKA